MTTLASQLVGTWRLVSREDPTAAGERRVDPGLGADPIALLVHDAAGNFTAQFMKRDRSTDVIAATGRASVNNSAVDLTSADVVVGTSAGRMWFEVFFHS